jgi:hypothetical protein
MTQASTDAREQQRGRPSGCPDSILIAKASSGEQAVDAAIRSLRADLALAACVLVLAACAGRSSSGDRAAPSGATPAGSAPSSIGIMRVGATTAATPSDVAALPTLRAATTQAGAVPLAISLNEVRVSGRLMQVTFTVTNRQPAANPNSWHVADFFNNGVHEANGAYSYPDHTSVDGVYVLDPKNAKRYLVARDPNQLCVCSIGSHFIKGGRSVTFTGTYQAPPADVTAVTVVIPKTAPFENVPVQR